MAEPTIDFSGYSNENIDRVLTLKSGTADESVAFDLTGASFLMEVRDAKNALVLRLTSDPSAGITITDAPNGVFRIHIAQGAIAYEPSRSLKYDLLLIASGETKRLFGGSIRISAGVSVPS